MQLPKQKGPAEDITKRELDHLLLCFCTFCCLIKGKKLSLQNIFVIVLKEEKLRKMLKTILTVETDFEMVKIFIEFEPQIAESKYITKYLNQNNKAFQKGT
tara:strand:+ start:1322 stop:1624 length:303 start_codon:yes stop_codon:yes gene_type:complete